MKEHINSSVWPRGLCTKWNIWGILVQIPPAEKRAYKLSNQRSPVLPQHPLHRNGLRGTQNREERASLTYGLPHRSHRTASARTDLDSLRPFCGWPFPALSIAITSPSPHQTQRAAHDTRCGRPLEQHGHACTPPMHGRPRRRGYGCRPSSHIIGRR